MREIKFTTSYESVLSFADRIFKIKYEERIGNNPCYTQSVGGEIKHLALCPRCDNPVVILGIYKKIDVSPHARHAKGVNIPNVVQYGEYRFQNCPYHKKRANYIKEYVPETEEPQRWELYGIAKDHFDKAIYMLQKGTGIYITHEMAEALAENYVIMRAYNYIDATMYNIPWYLIYSFPGFPLYHMVVRKDTALCRHLKKLGFVLRDSKIKGHVYVGSNEGQLVKATNYRYSVDKDEKLNEWVDFSIIRPDDTVTDTLLYVPMDRFSISVDSYYFGNLIRYSGWKPRQDLLDIAKKCMEP